MEPGDNGSPIISLPAASTIAAYIFIGLPVCVARLTSANDLKPVTFEAVKKIPGRSFDRETGVSNSTGHWGTIAVPTITVDDCRNARRVIFLLEYGIIIWGKTWKKYNDRA